jgi:hypothetical protein
MWAASRNRGADYSSQVAKGGSTHGRYRWSIDYSRFSITPGVTMLGRNLGALIRVLEQ